ncbi:helix-turn-helix domain-containing protein [Streptomyces profundus]|uniref:helix-turn-helix domain-containing protein n=1 Tax=Streptomyces profundus TaxID=2867410 RepID=UPI001D16EDA3|nr:helix-turn-helix domain-containing protein [Streptomyces sp. MA3_2.13]
MSNGNDKAKDRPSVGRTLQQARIDAKLTVDEVSSATRVRIPIVQAIENDDFSRCGGDVYARGHIRTLARAVGLDAAELIELYNDQQDTHPQPLSSGPLFEAERIRPEPRRPNWTAAMVAAIAVVIGFVGFTFFSQGDDDGGGGSVAERTETPGADSPGGEGPEKNGPEVPTPTEAPSESAVAGVPADKVTVRASVEGGSSWISAKDSNGRLLFEGVLEDGDSETFTDDEQIDLVLGNAGAVKLHVNGSEIEDVFESGQVQRLSYTLGDPEEG